MTDQRAVLYRKTAELLRQDGWTQGVSRDLLGKRCLVGAAGQVGMELGFGPFNPFNSNVLFLPLLTVLREQWDWNSGLAHWNDEPGRTFDEVITLLEQTAEKLEADETITEGMS
jgi:hypothetical protein